MMMRGTAQEKNRAEAEIDNEREGPGLRRGPMRTRPEVKSDIGNEWGKGWQDDDEKDASEFSLQPLTAGQELMNSGRQGRPR